MSQKFLLLDEKNELMEIEFGSFAYAKDAFLNKNKWL